MRNKILYIFELCLLIFIVLLKLIKTNISLEIPLVIFFCISFLVLYKLLGFWKSRNTCSFNAMQIIIISLLLYVLLTYLSGLYFGFLRNSYELSLKAIFINTYAIITIIVMEELIRWIVARSTKNSIKPLIILNILYILVDIVLEYNSFSLSKSTFFIFITESVLTSIARNTLATYITYKVSYVPSLIFRLFLSVYVYIVPIMPDYSHYITSVIGIVFPYLVYLSLNKLVKYMEHDRNHRIRKSMWYINIPLGICLVFLVILVSGIFRYQIMAIGSGSMEPLVYRGDAVIFEKISDDEEIHVGEIIVFKSGGKLVTHRVVDITNNRGIIRYVTKGDANKDNDNYPVAISDIEGKVKMKVKFIGLPTIWFQELIS